MNKIRKQEVDEALTELQKNAFEARRKFILRQHKLYKERYENAVRSAVSLKKKGLQFHPNYKYHIDTASQNLKQMEFLVKNDEELFI